MVIFSASCIPSPLMFKNVKIRDKYLRNNSMTDNDQRTDQPKKGLIESRKSRLKMCSNFGFVLRYLRGSGSCWSCKTFYECGVCVCVCVCVWEGGCVCAYDGVRVSLTISFVNSFSRTPNHLLTLSSTIC